jgi:hypothetical protein
MTLKNFILFLFGNFENMEEVEFFCFEILGVSPAVNSVKFVIENEKSIIVLFDSELERKELSAELHDTLTTDIVKFYFLFERESIYSANLPVQMRDFIFKPKDDNTSLRLKYTDTERTQIKSIEMDLDMILEKIEKSGIDSLSDDEKKFLDNFES